MKLFILQILVYFLIQSILFVDSNNHPGVASKTLSDFLALNSDDQCGDDDVTASPKTSRTITKPTEEEEERKDKLKNEIQEEQKVAFEEEVDDENLVNFTRIQLPRFENVDVNKPFTTVLPGDIEVNVTVLSVSPFIFGM